MDERRKQQNRQSQNQQRQPQQGQSETGRTAQASGRRQQGSGSLDSSGQQRQFDTQGSSQQSGGSATANRFADQIREHMEVVDASGKHCGTVDHIEGDRIKLTRSDSSGGQHQYVPMSQVAGIEGGKVCLRTRGDNDFGMEANR